MIVLVPRWAHHYDEFWSAIRSRNLWFIKIRYLFVVALLSFLLFGQFVLELNFSPKQVIVLPLLSLIILVYNVLIHALRRKVGSTPGRFNCLHLSLLQMLCDLTSLIILIYYTGLIESPFHIFVVIHSIIGSLILPGYVVITVIGLFLLTYTILIFSQHLNLLFSHCIPGLCGDTVPHSLNYVITFVLIFASVIIISVYIANKIAFQLYNREQQLKTSLEKIEQVEDKKQKYIIGVVHEIKTPISAIQSFANLLLDEYIGPLPEKVKEKIRRIKIRSSDALTLVNNVLYISRLKLLNLTSTEKIEIKPILAGIIEKQCSDVKLEEIEVELKDNRKFKHLIEADKLLLELAFSNLICNSFKYTKDGGKIIVTMKDNDTHLTVETSDSGIGIPQNELKNIFNEFYRATNVKHNGIEGSGLGLALVKEVIERHGGKIEITSPSKIGTVENPGTTVTVILPYESSTINSESN